MKRRHKKLGFSPSRFFIGALIGLIILAPIFFFFSQSDNSSLKLTSPTSNYISPTSVPTKLTNSNPTPQPKIPSATPKPSPVPTQQIPGQTAVGPGIPILMYHYVGYNPNPIDHARDLLSITPDKFTVQMDWLEKNDYHPIDLNTLYGIFANKTPRPPKPIVLTFDDGYNDFYFIAFPILRSHGFHSVSFVITGFVGKPAYLTWDQISEMNSSGLVDFEAHTVNHVTLPTLPYDKMLWELSTSKQTLSEHTGHPVNFIAYPFGASNGLVYQAALKAGFVGGLGTWPGWATGPGINMPRVRIVGTISLPEFIAKV